jgi:hypothetical protein
MAFPIGPVPVYIRVRDVSYFEEDGTFANVFEARSPILGLPVARVVFRVRPLDFAEGGAEAASASREVPA